MKKHLSNTVAALIILSMQTGLFAQENNQIINTGRFDLHNKENGYVVIDDQTMYYSTDLVLVSAVEKTYRRLDEIPSGTPVRYNYGVDMQSFFISRLEIIDNLPPSRPFDRENK